MPMFWHMLMYALWGIFIYNCPTWACLLRNKLSKDIHRMKCYGNVLWPCVRLMYMFDYMYLDYGFVLLLTYDLVMDMIYYELYWIWLMMDLLYSKCNAWYVYLYVVITCWVCGSFLAIFFRIVVGSFCRSLVTALSTRSTTEFLPEPLALYTTRFCFAL